jgi:hypothetical protein
VGAGCILLAAVGYEMYCQLLENAVRGLRNQRLRTPLEVHVDLPWNAFLPRDYVPGQKLRIEVFAQRLGSPLDGVLPWSLEPEANNPAVTLTELRFIEQIGVRVGPPAVRIEEERRPGVVIERRRVAPGVVIEGTDGRRRDCVTRSESETRNGVTVTERERDCR